LFSRSSNNAAERVHGVVPFVQENRRISLSASVMLFITLPQELYGIQRNSCVRKHSKTFRRSPPARLRVSNSKNEVRPFAQNRVAVTPYSLSDRPRPVRIFRPQHLTNARLLQINYSLWHQVGRTIDDRTRTPSPRCRPAATEAHLCIGEGAGKCHPIGAGYLPSLGWPRGMPLSTPDRNVLFFHPSLIR
jgi:hypothetical protein